MGAVNIPTFMGTAEPIGVWAQPTWIICGLMRRDVRYADERRRRGCRPGKTSISALDMATMPRVIAHAV